MKILDTSPITSAVGFPPKSGTWDFLQLAYQECVESIIRNFIGSSYSTSNGYILWGMLPSPPSSLTAGAIFYNGKIYLYPGGLVPASIFPNVTLVNISQTQYTTNADPVLFTDSNNYNVHNIFSISLSSGTSGTGDICNFSALIRLDSYAGLRGDITTLQSDIALGSWTTVAPSTGWTVGASSGFISAPIKYRMNGSGQIWLRGNLIPTSTTPNLMCVLPIAPTQTMYFPVVNEGAGWGAVSIDSSGNVRLVTTQTGGYAISLDGITFLNS